MEIVYKLTSEQIDHLTSLNNQKAITQASIQIEENKIIVIIEYIDIDEKLISLIKISS